jgi:hypothetical protein
MMIDESFARLRAHRNNIQRYRRLLHTHLTQLERDFVERRLAEECAALESLSHLIPNRSCGDADNRVAQALAQAV